MAHKAIMVVGDDWEGLMAPYSENIEAEEYKTNKVTQDDWSNMI